MAKIDAIKEKGNGHLNISTYFENNLIIKFTDTGTGIDEKNLRKIFHPFFTTKKDGTGLGLAISLSIIKNIGGDIKISSKLGVGTEVSVILEL